ncbi:MAG TPA: hypothetical protein VH476_05325, partial [Solirubrobacterales bacterium]
VKLPKNSVGTRELKRNSVDTAKIKSKAVTGAKLKLSSLGTVPEASHATTANHAQSADSADRAISADAAGTVGGLSVVKFERTGAVSLSSPETVVSLSGLRLEYACKPEDPVDHVAFRAATVVDGASLWLSRTFTGGSELEHKQPFEADETFNLVGWVGTGVYTAPDGGVVTFTYRNPLSCAEGVSGTAYGG